MIRFLAAAFSLSIAAASFAALSVPASLTTGVQTFDTTPPAADWSTVSIAGAAGNLTTVAAVDAAAQGLTAGGITTVLGSQAGNATNALAQRNSTAGFIYTAPTGNNATALMATLQNDSGSALNSITVAYDHNRIGAAAEESTGHRVFYSLTGAAGSWTLIPALSGIGGSFPLAANVTLSSAWTGGGPLYLLWADDNGSATDTPFTIDNFVVTASAGSPGPWSYSQNFDGMGGGAAPPGGWSFHGAFGGGNGTYTDSIPIPASAVGGGTVNNTLTAAAVFTGSSNTAGYNFALPASTGDRALGTSPTSGKFVALQLSLLNGTGAAIPAIRLGYDIRRFTEPATNELPGYFVFHSLDNGTTWNATSALDPSIATVPGTVGVSPMGPATISLASPWADGSALLIRWIDDNAGQSSPDQIIGLDHVSITLPVGQLPTVALTAPTAGAVFTVGDTIAMTATASDGDGAVTKVEFYQGGTKLGEDLEAPYAFNWTGFAAGGHNLSARATDDDGNTTSTAPAIITVNAGAGSGALARGPYLNQSNHNSIVIRWRSSQAVAGRVRYGGSPGNLTNIVDEASAQTDHIVQLTGLQPHTRYYYSIGSAIDTLAGGDAEHTFRTSPVPGTATDTRIWVVGDCGRGSQFQRDVRDAYYAWTGARAPDLCLMLGDNAYNSGTDAEYQTGFFGIYPAMFRKMPLWSTLGNHDANNGSTSPTANFPCFDMFTFPIAGECGGAASGTERYFSFDYGNIHIINLDSQTSSRSTIEVNGSDGPMAAWLRNDLASTTKTWIIAIFHHPPYSKGSHDSDTETQLIEMRNNFGRILEPGGVDMVLVGHSHCYERSMLVDGHYGTSGTLTDAMKKNAGSGRPGGTGAYIKPLTGPRDHFGAVYALAGSAGSADGGPLNHPVMHVSYNTGGTLNLDINGNTLNATYIEKGPATGTYTTPDTFTIIKQGAADSDGDGVADEFELAHGMNRFSSADAGIDPDFDSNDALDEYLFGLNPGQSDRYPWTTTRDPGTGHITVSFPTLPQRIYQVSYSHDLLNWLPGSAALNGTGAALQWTDDGTVTGSVPSSAARRFYKVTVMNGP